MSTERCVVPRDVVFKKGQIRFGMKEGNRGIEAVILPQFDIRRYGLGSVTKAVTQINKTPRGYHDGQCEQLLKKSIGDMGTRCIIANGNLIPLDQEAATMLLQMKLPMLKERHFIPV